MRLLYRKYSVSRGVQKVKTKGGIAIMVLGLVVGGGGLSLASFGAAHADTIPSINFESGYIAGNIDGQNGWMKTGPYDVAVANVSSFSNASGFGFGTKALRLSNAVTSGSFGDQTFSPGLSQSVGESEANKEFNMSFSIGSTQASRQPGLFLSVSPDDGNGSRMSYVGFDDQADGIHVIFYDVTDNGPLPTTANFNESDVATISRTAAHTIRLSVDTIPGPGNDVVKLYVDGTLKHTGTSWEDYYRYDPEQTGNGNEVPVISKVLFREGGDAASGTSGNGYLVDNLSYSSGQISSSVPTHYSDCRNGGWRQFNDPSFKNQGKCMNYVWHHAHDIFGDDVKYTAYGLKREANFWMSTSLNRGHFHYSDANHDWYDVRVSNVSVNGNDGYFAGQVTHASNHSWVGNWLYGEVENGHPDQIWGSFTSQTTAENSVDSMSPSPADGPFAVTHGNISIRHRG